MERVLGGSQNWEESGGSQWEKGWRKPKEPTNLHHKHSGDGFVTIQPCLPSQRHLLPRVHSTSQGDQQTRLKFTSPSPSRKRRSSILPLSQKEVVTAVTNLQNCVWWETDNSTKWQGAIRKGNQHHPARKVINISHEYVFYYMQSHLRTKVRMWKMSQMWILPLRN